MPKPRKSIAIARRQIKGSREPLRNRQFPALGRPGCEPAGALFVGPARVECRMARCVGLRAWLRSRPWPWR
jgi:hypothetical protein